MGRTLGLYNAEFPKGTKVRVKNRAFLELFTREWKFHNPLLPEQLDVARTVTTVSDVGFYHGGDEIYSLNNVPGLWHEACLESE